MRERTRALLSQRAKLCSHSFSKQKQYSTQRNWYQKRERERMG